MQISTERHSVRGFLLKRRIFLPSLPTLAGGRGDRGGKDERDNWITNFGNCENKESQIPGAKWVWCVFSDTEGVLDLNSQ